MVRPEFGRGCSSGVEHDLAKVGVEGSNPFARSKQIPKNQRKPCTSAMTFRPPSPSTTREPCPDACRIWALLGQKVHARFSTIHRAQSDGLWGIMFPPRTTRKNALRVVRSSDRCVQRRSSVARAAGRLRSESATEEHPSVWP